MSEKMNVQNLNLSQTEVFSSQNYGESNIEAVRAKMSAKRQGESRSKQVYTLIQINSPCEVKISERSRKICARALMK